MSLKINAIIVRFFKGAIAGALAQMSLITIAVPQTWSDLGQTMNLLLLAGLTGAIGGGLLALEKWYSWIDTTETMPTI